MTTLLNAAELLEVLKYLEPEAQIQGDIHGTSCTVNRQAVDEVVVGCKTLAAEVVRLTSENEQLEKRVKELEGVLEEILIQGWGNEYGNEWLNRLCKAALAAKQDGALQ